MITYWSSEEAASQYHSHGSTIHNTEKEKRKDTHGTTLPKGIIYVDPDSMSLDGTVSEASGVLVRCKKSARQYHIKFHDGHTDGAKAKLLRMFARGAGTSLSRNSDECM